jgi:hypothetical protein
MAQFSNASFPQTAIAFRGLTGINGFPAGPKDSTLTLGGYLDSADANNNATDILNFGIVVSSLSGSGSQWAVGKPSASYFMRGISMFDAGISENEPFKSSGYLKGSPAVVCFAGLLRLTSWTSVHTAALTTPVLACKIVTKDTTGVIEFIPSGQAVDSGYTDISAYVKLVSYEAGVGALLSVKFY